jgi:hypothetical protein
MGDERARHESLAELASATFFGTLENRGTSFSEILPDPVTAVTSQSRGSSTSTVRPSFPLDLARANACRLESVHSPEARSS